MLCKKPFRKGVLAFGCGQCFPCRLNRRRLWTHRLLLESVKHADSCFVTLTYDEKGMPYGATVRPKDAQDWLKRLRSKVVNRVRYYLVGEYGERTQRPHYHAALFGIGPGDAEVIRSTWTKGFVHVGDLTAHSAQYIVGYVTKKMTKRDDPRLKGRHPEFARMSRKPGIGANAMVDVVNSLTTSAGAEFIILNKDVPMSIDHGRKKMPLGRYLRERLRSIYGFEEIGTSEEGLAELSQKMSDMYWEAVSHPKGPTAGFKAQFEEAEQKRLNLEAKSRLFTNKGDL